MEAAGRVVPATSARYGSCRRRARQPSTEHRVHVCHHVLRPWGQRALLSTAKCHHRVARHRLPLRYTTRAAGCCRAPPCIMEFRGRGHRVPPIATKCTHRRFQRALQRVAPSGTRASEQHQVSTFAVSGAQFSRATVHHRAPPCAALRAMPTDLTLICAGALQEPSQPSLRRAKTATQANAGRRAPPDATECRKVHTSARHRAPPCGVTARCRLPPATAFHCAPPRSTACR